MPAFIVIAFLAFHQKKVNSAGIFYNNSKDMVWLARPRQGLRWQLQKRRISCALPCSWIHFGAEQF
jgi:hypothetical protein